MKILRTRRSERAFSLPTEDFQSIQIQQQQQQLSPQDLQLENMKMQRQIMMNQRQRQKLQAQETLDKMRQVQISQKLEQKRDEQSWYHHKLHPSQRSWSCTWCQSWDTSKNQNQ